MFVAIAAAGAFSEWILSKITKIHWSHVFLSSYSGRRRLFPTGYCQDMSRHVDFRSLFLKILETKSHKNRICSSGEFEVIWLFQISREGPTRAPRPFFPRRRFSVSQQNRHHHIYIYIPCRSIPCHNIPCHNNRCCNISCCEIPCRNIPYCNIPCRNMPCRNIPCRYVPCHNIPCCIILP